MKCLSASFQQSRKLPLEALPHIPPLLRKTPVLALAVTRNVESSTQAGLHAPLSSAPLARGECTGNRTANRNRNLPSARNRTFLPLAALCSLPLFLTFRNTEYVFFIRIQISKEQSTQHFFPQGMQQLLY